MGLCWPEVLRPSGKRDLGAALLRVVVELIVACVLSFEFLVSDMVWLEVLLVSFLI